MVHSQFWGTLHSLNVFIEHYAGCSIVFALLATLKKPFFYPPPTTFTISRLPSDHSRVLLDSRLQETF